MDLYKDAGKQTQQSIRSLLLRLDGCQGVPFLIHLLESGTDVEKLVAARILGDRGCSLAAPVLRVAARSGDELLARTAVQSLGYIRNPDDAELLTAMLQEAEAPLREEILAALGMVGGPGVYETLKQTALSPEEEAKVRAAAVRGLWLLEDPRTGALFLNEYLNGLWEEETLRKEVEKHLPRCLFALNLMNSRALWMTLLIMLQLGETNLGKPLFLVAVGIVRAVEKPCEDLHSRERAVKRVQQLREAWLDGMAWIRDPGFAPSLVSRLLSVMHQTDALDLRHVWLDERIEEERKNLAMREGQAQEEVETGGGETEGRESSRQLDRWEKGRTRLLARKKELRREWAATLLTLAYSPDAGVREYAVRSLSDLARDEELLYVFETLRVLYGDRAAYASFLEEEVYPHEDVRLKGHVIREIVRWGAPAAVVRIREWALGQEDPELVFLGLEGIRDLDPAERADRLVRLTDHGTEKIRREALRRLDPYVTYIDAQRGSLPFPQPAEGSGEGWASLLGVRAWSCRDDVMQACVQRTRDPDPEVRRLSWELRDKLIRKCEDHAYFHGVRPPPGLPLLEERFTAGLADLRARLRETAGVSCRMTPPAGLSDSGCDVSIGWIHSLWDVSDVTERAGCLLQALETLHPSGLAPGFREPEVVSRRAGAITGMMQVPDTIRGNDGASPTDPPAATVHELRNRADLDPVSAEIMDALFWPSVLGYILAGYQGRSSPDEAEERFARMYLNGGILSGFALAYFRGLGGSEDLGKVLERLAAREDEELDRAVVLIAWDLQFFVPEGMWKNMAPVVHGILQARGWGGDLHFKNGRFAAVAPVPGSALEPSGQAARAWALAALTENRGDPVAESLCFSLASAPPERTDILVAVAMLRFGCPERKRAGAHALAERIQTNVRLMKGDLARSWARDRSSGVRPPVFSGEEMQVLHRAVWDDDVSVGFAARNALYAVRSLYLSVAITGYADPRVFQETTSLSLDSGR